MMEKAVMLSIKPEWCQLIASGKKKIEVRKTMPKLETPFKVFIYCTDGFSFSSDEVVNGWRKKVIGDFVCNQIDWMTHVGSNRDDIRLMLTDKYFVCKQIGYEYTERCCLTTGELEEYSNGGNLYGWHISDLVIYHEPLELSKFRHCGANYHYNAPAVSRPPQSWCYVKEEEQA